jgi:hypothetical protein
MIISRNIHADLSRECHSAITAPSAISIPPDDRNGFKKSAELVDFRVGICGHPSVAACECASVGGVGTNSHPEHGVFDSMMMQDYAEQQTIPAALLRASVFTPQSA